MELTIGGTITAGVIVLMGYLLIIGGVGWGGNSTLILIGLVIGIFMLLRRKG